MRTVPSWLVIVLACVGCAPEGAPARIEPVVYGTDGRRELYEVDDATRERARAIATLMRRTRLDTRDPTQPATSAVTLGFDEDLCEGERFRDQPAAGYCSGTLIDDDLFMTAGHCVDDAADCTRFRIVFDYAYESADTLATLGPDDVYSCRRIVVRGSAEDPAWADHVIIQLDRPVVGRTPATVRAGPVSVGDPITMIGFPDGIPMKIHEGGFVLDPRATTLDRFYTTLDAFHSNSGSAVFDAAGLVVGLLSGGADDYVDTGDCNIVSVLPETCTGADCDAYGERVAYARAAIDDLCASGWPSERLCAVAASCGDGTCSGTETPATCAGDCDAAVCGDAVCDLDEWTSCGADCGVLVPAAWTCRVGYYGTSDGCDCECGVQDLDCADPGERILNCEAGESCVAGECVAGPDGGPRRDAGADASATLDASMTPDASMETPDASMTPTAASPGCGCTVASASPTGALALLGLVLALVWRRRR